MNKTSWKPWHKVVAVRDDLKSGELPLAIFAADLYDVVMDKARRVYQNPGEFFALTYPTFNLRELCKDVITRLAGKSEKAIRQLELTYGGGKTHTLIALYHLVSDPSALPDLPAVDEFIQHIGMKPPRARVAALSFDKLDVEKGMEVRAPDGKTRWLKHPWSVLAFQLAGSDGLKLIHSEDRDEERESAPAENLLTELLAMPQKEDLSTLILIDEVLMYVREKVGFDPSWRSKLINFFQYLTQATTKIDRCAIVASLLATDPRKSDELGKQLVQELYAIFRREREEGVQPVLKEDVAEVLRRRFFTADSIRDREGFRPHVVAALKGITDLDDQAKKESKTLEERFLRSYPFHPDLTDVFYAKWTNLEGFQRTRGILRTFALALRDAENWDECPLIGLNVFLGTPDDEDLSESARELTTIAETEEYEGKRQDWSGILIGELGKAHQIQDEFTGPKCREVEQAVFATFLHSQPIGQKASTRELMLLLGSTRPDKIELEKSLLRWTEVSWFLDEAEIQGAEAAEGQSRLPKSWRLGSKPNLRQMHHDACEHISDELVEAKLLEQISRIKSLTAGASAAGARVHTLPARPNDIEDDGEFHFGILDPSAVSDSGKPSAEARRFLKETTSTDRPRVFQNAIVLAAPSRDGLEVTRNRIRDHLGWEEVRNKLRDQEVDPLRMDLLEANIDGALKKVPDAIRQAYCIVVTVSEKSEIQAFKITVEDDNLFNLIKNDERSRIQDTEISADALLPGGPYELWREDEPSRRVKDLVGAFAQLPHLPKMLNRKAILDTLVSGCEEGTFVLMLTRPDRSKRTFWRERPDEAALKDPSLEAFLPESVELTQIAPGRLTSGELPELWQTEPITFKDLCAYFSGENVVQIQREGYEEPVTIPKAEKKVVEDAVRQAVLEGYLWLTSGPASILKEEIPAGVLTDDAQLQGPPEAVSTMDILPDNLPDAWQDSSTTALAISAALSSKIGKTLPWLVVSEAIDGAIRARFLETAEDSGAWPCDLSGAQVVKLRIPEEGPGPGPKPPKPRPGTRTAEAEVKTVEIQDLADVIGDVVSAAAGYDLKFRIRIELGGDTPPSEEVVEKVNEVLRDISSDLELR